MSGARVHLSQQQMEYLRQAEFLPPTLARVVEAANPKGGDEATTLAVSPDVAEAFRSAFTDRLSRVGFDANYEPTIEGRVLEELIDRFFLG